MSVAERGQSGEKIDGFISLDLSDELEHAIQVSNLAYEVSHELNLEENYCYELAVAGMLHDIGKLKLSSCFEEDQEPLVIEELKYVRTHPALGYEELIGQGYSDNILKSILYHHENYDGSGYPGNLRGEEIPFGARILRVCDVYSALCADRPYRKAFEKEAAMEQMIKDVKLFDMQIFLAFQRVAHEDVEEDER